MQTMDYTKLSMAEKWDLTAKDYDSGAENATAKYLPDLITHSGLSQVLAKPSHTSIHILDIAGGNGLLPLYVLSQMNSDCKWNNQNFQFLCTDFSKSMVEIAEQNLQKSNFSQDLKSLVQYRVMDGQNLEIKDGMFEFAFSNFGVFLFPDKKKGLQEMYRVLKPGGKGTLSAWTPNYFSCMSDLYDRIAKYEELKLAQNVFKNRTIGFKDEQQVLEELQEVGFKNVQVIRTSHFFTLKDRNAAVQFVKTNPFTLSQLHDKSEEYQNKYFEIYGKEMESQFWNPSTQRIEIPSEAFIITGEK